MLFFRNTCFPGNRDPQYQTLMAKHKAKNKKKKVASKKKAGKSTASNQPVVPAETRSSESLTVFWAVSILILMTTNALTLFGHFYVKANPDAEKMKLFGSLMLFNGAVTAASPTPALAWG